MDGNHTSEDHYRVQREQMVEDQVKRRGVADPAVLEAMRQVPRHLFMPEDMREHAYEDSPLPIGYGQTISQPFVVASMTEHLRLTPHSHVLEVGTGSAYQTAILAEIAQDVYSIEVVPDLAEHAKHLLTSLDYRNVHTRVGDGSQGWPDAAPFDAIIVTAAAQQIPAALVNQLGPDGRMVIPVRSPEPDSQDLVLVTRTSQGIQHEVLYPVRFVPLQSR